MKSVLAIAILAMAGSASAQFANSNAAAPASKTTRSVDTNGWQKLYVSYNPYKIVSDVSGSDDIDMTAFSLGYSKGFSIAQDLPLFVEAGIEATYAFKTLDDNITYSNVELEQKMTYLSATVPVNLAYKFSVPAKNLSIVPYVGVNLKGNIIGKLKKNIVSDLEKSSYDTEKEFWKAYENKDANPPRLQEMDYFDKKETGNKDTQWKRVQFGWQLGIGIHYNQVYVGLGYSKDLSELCKKQKVSKTSITLGYSF